MVTTNIDYTIAIIGAGRYGRSVSTILHSKNIPHQLVLRSQSIPIVDIYYLCVPDNQLEILVKEIPQSGVCLHAAGSKDERILNPHPCKGVLHPIMSFPGPEIMIPSTPIPATFTGDLEARPAALWLGDHLGYTLFDVSGDRALYHAAAVMAGNFATVLLRMAGDLLAECGAEEPHASLVPLAIQSIQSAGQYPIRHSLTGPIARGDNETLARHQEALKRLPPHYLKAYKHLTESAKSQINIESLTDMSVLENRNIKETDKK
jgi:predicted short-subunit dehydrogenase-like oxidoreductase (DUF2520 family)